MREHLRVAIAGLANEVFRVRMPEVWGEATTACTSDSKKFGAWDQNLMMEGIIRHKGRGVMVYWKLLWFVKSYSTVSAEVRMVGITKS